MVSQTTNQLCLTDLSPRDRIWDAQHAQAMRIEKMYEGSIHNRYAERMSLCANLLDFLQVPDDNGLVALNLYAARFCRVRHCPICAWRRSLMWRAKAAKTIPLIVEDFPKHRFIFLTLTIRNCELDKLRETLSVMNRAWSKLTQRKDFPADGWFKFLEIKRAADDKAHPHFHCVLLVPPGYFGNNYLSHERWVELWRSCLGVDYQPIVNVKVVARNPKHERERQQRIQEISKAVQYALKYSGKGESVVLSQDNKNQSSKEETAQLPDERLLVDRDWLVRLTNQTHKTRAIATGGVMREYLKSLEEEPEDLIHASEELPDDDCSDPDFNLRFYWGKQDKRYELID